MLSAAVRNMLKVALFLILAALFLAALFLFAAPSE